MNPAEDSSLNGRYRSATSDKSSISQSSGRLDVSGELNFEAEEQDYLSVKETAYQSKRIKLKNSELPIEEGEVIEHTASGEIEDGEINDTSNVDSRDIYCRFYKLGNCAFGKDCRFFHLSDKGLYNMFESHPAVSKIEKVYCKPRISQDRDYYSPFPSFEETETDWDLALKEAMMRVKNSREKTEREYDKLYMTVHRDKPAPLDSPRRNKDDHLLFRKVHYDYDKESRHGIASAKCNSTKSNFNPESQISYKRFASTPKRKRSSSRSVSDRSRSRSCCRSVRCEFNCRCCQTPSSKYRRHYVSSRRSSNYRRYVSSSSESSLSGSSKGVSKRYRKVRSSSVKKRQSRAHLASSKEAKIIPSHTEILLVRKPDRNISPDVKRKRCPISPKRQVTAKFEPSFSESRNRSCSDMSISPLSFSLSSQKDAQSEEQSVSYYSPDRNLSDMSISSFSNEERFESPNTHCSVRRPSDMSISPLSDSSNPCEFSDQIEINVTEQLKSSFEIQKQDSISKEPLDNQKSVRLKSISSGTKVKKKSNDPLLMDLMKYHGKFKSNNSSVRLKDVESKKSLGVNPALLATADVHPQTKCHVKGKQETNLIRDKLSKKELLIKRLQEVNAAIARKKALSLQKT